MLNLEPFKVNIKHKPAISKSDYLQVLNRVGEMYANAIENKDRVVNIGKVYKPKEVKRYDIVTSYVCNSPHPCLVYKSDGDMVIAISMSTTEAPHNVHKFEKSRFFPDSYLTNTVIRMTQETALGQFVGIFDNKKEADKAFAKVKAIYKDIFKF